MKRIRNARTIKELNNALIEARATLPDSEFGKLFQEASQKEREIRLQSDPIRVKMIMNTSPDEILGHVYKAVK